MTPGRALGRSTIGKETIFSGSPGWVRGANRNSVGDRGPAEKMTASRAARAVAVDFSRIPIFPLVDSERYRMLPPDAASPFLGHVQTKLRLGGARDPLEAEADRVADQGMRLPATRGTVGGIPRGVERHPQQSNGPSGLAPATVGRALASPGRALEPALRNDLEQRIGYDFSRVRVHDDAAAGESAREVDARAYTLGHDIVFGAGQFAPTTSDGRRLIAHELAHVVQQSNTAAGNAQTVQRDGTRGRTQPEEEERDKERRDRRSMDSRRDRQELGLRDPFDDLDSDWAGRMILGQYLYGGGRDIDVRDDPAWTAYMTKSRLLRSQVWVQVISAAKDLVQLHKPGRRATATRFHAEVENGEGIIGYQYLHGTNKGVGDFLVVGFGEVTEFQGPHPAVARGDSLFSPPKVVQQGAGSRVDLELSYVWNDIIDPNAAYITDKIKSGIAYAITLGQPRSYRLSIGWHNTCSVWFPASGGVLLTGGYPEL